MSEMQQAIARVWMAFGDVFHDLAHSCYMRAAALEGNSDDT